jgi:hypothetical protein
MPVSNSPLRGGSAMAKPDIHNLDGLRTELNQLLQKQSKTLDARMHGGVSDTELIEL